MCRHNKRTKLTKEEREQVGDLMIHTLIVEAHCRSYMAESVTTPSRAACRLI
jgi:hypothetical protein